jgi:hypothetical protein
VDVRQATLQYLQGEVPTHVSRGISESLALLARDPETRIRAVVARDHRIDDSVIAELGRDTAPEVRQTVLDFHQLKVSTDLGLLDEPEPASRLKAANTLLSKEWWGNTSASRLASEKAARDSDPAVRLVTAKSAHATCVALSLLIDDPDPQVQQALAERPMFRSWCKTARLNAGIGLRSRRAALAAATSGNPALRAMAAGMTGAGTRSLKDLSRDVSWFVRHTVAGHPKVESTVLASLAEDPHPLVRARAQSRIAKP